MPLFRSLPAVLGLWLALAAAARAADRAPDLTLTGSVGAADLETWREVPFTLPAGTARLTVEYSYTGRDDPTTITMGLRDPQRMRGASGADKTRVVLEEADATPSYLPGPLPAGTWRVVLGISEIRTASTYTIKVWFDRADTPFPGFLAAPIKAGPGWYRGDLHMHTAHSDGTCPSRRGVTVPCPVFKTLEAARAKGLDFIAVTDHNTTSQNESLRELAPYFDDLLVIPAREMTTFDGHANVFGPTGFLDYEVRSPYAPTLDALLDEVAAAQGLISVNHPGAEPDCIGCRWKYEGVDYDRIQAVEVVNGGSLSDTGSPEKRSSFPFWEAWLNAGHRITGISGSDDHDASDDRPDGEGVGRPTTVVHAAELSQAAVLEAIRRGHAFVDVWGSREGLLEVEARLGEVRAEMGDALPAGPGATVVVAVHVAGAPKGAVISLAGDGAKLARLTNAGLGAAETRRTFDLTADGAAHWLRVDVRAADGRLLLVGNPIYLRPAG